MTLLKLKIRLKVKQLEQIHRNRKYSIYFELQIRKVFTTKVLIYGTEEHFFTDIGFLVIMEETDEEIAKVEKLN